MRQQNHLIHTKHKFFILSLSSMNNHNSKCCRKFSTIVVNGNCALRLVTGGFSHSFYFKLKRCDNGVC